MRLMAALAIGCGLLTVAVLACALVLGASGRPDLAHVAVRVSLVVGVICCLAALMAGIIVWCEVRAGLALEHSPRSEAVPSAASQSRATFSKGVR